MKVSRFNAWLGQFQHCCYCGRPSFEYRHLCRHCFTDFCRQNNGALSLMGGLGGALREMNVLCLGSYKDALMASWVKALKGGGSRSDPKWIAGEWVRRRNLSTGRVLKAPVVVIPSPSRGSEAEDHAMALARALAESQGWTLKNILSFQNNRDEVQKSKDREARRLRRFSRTEALPSSVGSVIFVDDVVTTGSTVLAAWRALGEPQGFEAWCMAHQPMLAALAQD